MSRENFRKLLKEEFERRVAKNSSYSLRAYASFLGIYHGTLSGLISGKRVISNLTINKLAPKLGLNPSDFLTKATPLGKRKITISRHLLQKDIFNSISDWTYDAILEFSLLEGKSITPSAVSNYFLISLKEATEAIESLKRLGLLVETEDGLKVQQARHSTNLESPDATSLAMRKHQKRILEKSIESVKIQDVSERHHRSLTFAIKKSDSEKAKLLISQFMEEMSQLLQEDAEDKSFDEIYQLHVGFFPLKGLGKESKNEIDL